MIPPSPYTASDNSNPSTYCPVQSVERVQSREDVVFLYPGDVATRPKEIEFLNFIKRDKSCEVSVRVPEVGRRPTTNRPSVTEPPGELLACQSLAHALADFLSSSRYYTG